MCNRERTMWVQTGKRVHGSAFAVILVCEKICRGKDAFWAFMDLEKAYDTIDGRWYVVRCSVCIFGIL